MTKPDSSLSPQLQIDSKTLNAILAATSVLAVAFLNLSSVATLTIQNNQINWQTYIELSAIAWLLITAFVILARVLSGNIERNIWILVYTFLIVAGIRVMIREEIGLPFGIITASIIAAISYLALPQQQAGRATTLGLLTGAAIVLFDQYAVFLYTRQISPPSLVTATTNLAGFAFIFQVVVLLVQLPNLSLDAKLSNLFSSFTILAGISLGFLGVYSLSNSITTQRNDALLGESKQAAIQVDNYIKSNLSALAVEGRMPVFGKYLLSRRPSNNFDVQLASEAIQVLKTLKLKDPNLIESYGLLDLEGNDILDTNPSNIGKPEAGNEYFDQPLSTGLTYISPVYYSTNDHKSYIYFSAPVRDKNEIILGVLRVRYNSIFLQNIIKEYNNAIGSNSRVMLIDDNGVILVYGTKNDLLMKSVLPLNNDQILSLQKQGRLLPGRPEDVVLSFNSLANGLENSINNPVFTATTGIPTNSEGTVDIVAAAPLYSSPWKILLSQPEESLLSPVKTTQRTAITSAVLIVLLGSALGTRLVRTMTRPIQALTKTAAVISEGNLTARAPVVSKDEIGVLSNTFNNMAEQLNFMVTQLEGRVAERTEALERRVRQLQTSAEIGGVAASLRNIDDLLNETTRLIGERFGFYHSGIFLLDERGEYAVLHAANSPGGKKMLALGHRLKVGATGIVGTVTHTGNARIALDVGKDAVFFDNPDLPDTRSEMALPLKAAGRILGALDVQSTQAGAFKDADVAILQIVADQIAIAIENARLFDENREALESARRAYGEVSRSAWIDLLRRTSGSLGYLSIAQVGLAPVSGSWDSGMAQSANSGQITVSSDGKNLSAPIKIRGQVIGVIRLKKNENDANWSPDEISTAETLADQLSNALESARLYEEARQRATREQTISQITTAISSATTFDDILRMTVQEIGNTLNDSEVSIQIISDSEEQKSGN